MSRMIDGLIDVRPSMEDVGPREQQPEPTRRVVWTNQRTTAPQGSCASGDERRLPLPSGRKSLILWNGAP